MRIKTKITHQSSLCVYIYISLPWKLHKTMIEGKNDYIYITGLNKCIIKLLSFIIIIQNQLEHP